MWQIAINAGSTWKIYGYSEYFFFSAFLWKNFQVKRWGNKGPSQAPSSLVLQSLS